MTDGVCDSGDDNRFTPLAEMFPDERFNEIDQLFNEAFDKGAGKDQWKLNGLAMLLTCLEGGEEPEDTLTTLDVPIICKQQALQAAYWLGKNSRK